MIASNMPPKVPHRSSTPRDRLACQFHSSIAPHRVRVALARRLKTVHQRRQFLHLLLGQIDHLCVLLDARHGRRPRDRDDGRVAGTLALAADPGDGQLCGCATLLLREGLGLLDELEVVLEVLALEAGVGAEVADERVRLGEATCE